FDNVQHGGLGDHIVALNRARLGQYSFIKRSNDLDCSLDGRAQAWNDLASGPAVTCVKFRLAIALDRLASDASDDPLPYVACEMKNQIRDAVDMCVGPRPEFLGCQNR